MPGLAGQLLGPGPGDPQQRDLRGRAPPGPGDQRQGQQRDASPSARSPGPFWPFGGPGRMAVGRCSRRPGGRAGPQCPPRREQPVLQAEHRGVLVRVGVVVAEQVQDAVHGAAARARPRRVTGLAGLLRGHRRAEHHVAEQPGQRLGLGGRPGRCAPRPGAAAAARPSGRPARRSGPARPSSARAARSWRRCRPAGRTAQPAGARRISSSTWRASARGPPHRPRRRTRWRSRCSRRSPVPAARRPRRRPAGRLPSGCVGRLGPACAASYRS